MFYKLVSVITFYLNNFLNITFGIVHCFIKGVVEYTHTVRSATHSNSPFLRVLFIFLYFVIRTWFRFLLYHDHVYNLFNLLRLAVFSFVFDFVRMFLLVLISSLDFLFKIADIYLVKD